MIIDSALAGHTTADECTWTLSDGVLQAGAQALKSIGAETATGPFNKSLSHVIFGFSEASSVLGLGQTGVISCWKGNSGEG